ncbi:hypothetical protein ElyMa_005359000 [Elysia marginata]|uniref:Uncharacterized protein n=1 Tax=Elysia marginata TaxID=1093978 RepID=A0AAV4EBR7_9GAST|nr:hypothetical protein ElyMa_005359000 [Elysia marginata]
MVMMMMMVMRMAKTMMMMVVVVIVVIIVVVGDGENVMMMHALTGELIWYPPRSNVTVPIVKLCEDPQDQRKDRRLIVGGAFLSGAITGALNLLCFLRWKRECMQRARRRRVGRERERGGVRRHVRVSLICTRKL